MVRGGGRKGPGHARARWLRLAKRLSQILSFEYRKIWEWKQFESKCASSNGYNDFCNFGLMMCIRERTPGGYSGGYGQQKATDCTKLPLPPFVFEALGLDEIRGQAEMNPWYEAIWQMAHLFLKPGGVYRHIKK